ncbi:hypothetical protein SETIT_2G003800v2 [Setaria italica]|uniref:AAA+ ATPase domain-containing protein n=2 Tax=Setaria italica TaxID=4555 RepID=A0A368PU16_SETIT|nr:AAA-ATPase At3g28510 [Setaria italica]RCV09152.1 hypothetical protein SETIT_2G003800v2 [Setaria italica]
MMATMKQWVSDGIRSAGFLLWAPLLASYAPRGLPNMYFNLHLRRYARRLVPLLDPFVTIDIVSKKPSSSSFAKPSEYDKCSDAYQEVKAYLTKRCSRDALAFRADATGQRCSFLLSLRQGQEVTDHFQGVTMWWLLVPRKRGVSEEKSRLRLMFPQRHRALIVDEYLPHVRRQGREDMFGNRRQSLYTNKNKREYYGGDDKVWSKMDFEHPSTFDTLAMHPNKKRRIMEDLDSFRGNKDYYCRIGKPWKRGYLLYGPPGTGKSTMIAAMANYLNYDIYDIELTSLSNNSELRDLVTNMTSKSIIVIEDIDCCFDDFNSQRTENKSQSISSGYEKKERVTMSGLLNFIDGVWSTLSGERIIVLTTNFPEKLDPALIRRGRMDMHIEMSYCCFEAFKMLARNYLGIGAHPLFQRVEELLQVVEITPADVAECLLKDEVPGSDRGVEAFLGRLIEELEKKAQEQKGKVGNIAAAKPKRQRR